MTKTHLITLATILLFAGQATNANPLLVPYIHQCYDTNDNFVGSWACAPTSAVMVLAYYGRISPHPIWVSSPSPGHDSDYGWYVSSEYTYGSHTFSEYSEEDTISCGIAKGKGAWGYIWQGGENNVKDYLIDYLGLHDFDVTFHSHPTETEARNLVQQEIDNNRPLIARTYLTSGHYVVVVGYEIDASDNFWYKVNDSFGDKPYGDTCWGDYGVQQPVSYSYSQMDLGNSSGERGLITISGETLFVSLDAQPASGTAPLNVSLTAEVSGTAAGTINYSFWWNCNDPSTSVSYVSSVCGDPWNSVYGEKHDNIEQTSYTVTHIYSSPGIYTAKVIVERGGAPPVEKRVTITVNASPCSVSTPTTPSGPTSGQTGQNLSYSTGGSTCSNGHSVEYRFDWGDGSGYSAWSSSATQSHTYSSASTYSVKAQARCASTLVESGWSGGRSVTISHGTNVGGLICTNTTWTLAGSPYVVTGSSGVVIGCGATLTIEPGVVVKFNSTRTIMVGQATYGTGNLVARGIPEAPIIFTSVKDPCDPCNLAAAGDWRQIYFTDYSVDATYDSNDDYLSGSILEYIIVEYAGYGNSGAIFAEKSSPCLNYCEVRHNSYYGIQVDGTNAPNINIGNCEVWDNSQCGIYIANGSGHKLLNNYIHNNRSSGISFNSTGGNILLGNTITGSTVSGSGGGIYFFPSCGSDCGGSNTLSGNTITGNTASDSGGGIYFGGQCGPGYGYSSSNGNTLSENTITDNTAGGSGGGIYFIASSGNTLTGNTITGNIATNGVGGGIYFGYLLCGYCYWNCWEEYHGSNSNALSGNIIQNNTSQNGSIYIDGSSNCTFSHNIITGNHTDAGTTGGIYVTGTSTYYSSTFLTNYSAHISLAGDPNTGTYNIIHSNDGYQIYNDNPFDVDGQYDVNAIYVQWGTSDFGIIEDLIYDWFDDSSKDFVVCWPFVTEILGDFDGDWDVDEADLGTFCNNWLRADCNAPDWCEGADLDLSHEVDFLDFAIFAKHWLEGI